MSFHRPFPPGRRTRATRGMVRASMPRRAGGRRRMRPPASAAELRLVVLLGLFLGLAYGGMDAPGAWGSAALDGVASDGAGPSAIAADFGLCHTGGGWNCVVDGDTFYASGVKVRVADIDTPETHPPRCAAEARLGEAATLRMRALLNAGPFTMAAIDRDEDRYGRKLRIAMRDGESLGDTLVAEGLARPYAGGRRAWC